jgi:Lrp/AsnC family leucine-responsive transcriptional regulator
MKAYDLDDQDRAILHLLAEHGRLTNIELAKRLPLSHSAISRRITRLERNGAIRGYGASIDPLALDHTIRAFVGVRRNPAASVDAIATVLRAIDGVSGCWIVTGEHDFLLDVRAKDMPELSATLLNRIQKVEGVVSTLSTFVLSEASVTAAVE